LEDFAISENEQGENPAGVRLKGHPWPAQLVRERGKIEKKKGDLGVATLFRRGTQKKG